MKKSTKMSIITFIFLFVIFSAISGCSHTPYVKVGAGVKVQETPLYIIKDGSKFNEPISARLEAGFEHGSWSYGVSHHSQWFSGFPFNNDKEYGKTEIFIDYKYVWKK